MMRLINCKTLEFETDGDWAGSGTPPYAILSHTWAVDGSEVTLQEYIGGRVQYPDGNWEKIDKSVEIARRQNFGYIWIDSCCIDKTNNAELSEAINSMFKWYAAANVCYAQLQDVTFEPENKTNVTLIQDNTISQAETSILAKCRWFTRGFTLQELIAPAHVEFYDSAWQHFGTRHGLGLTLSNITSIDVNVLASPESGASRDLRQILDNVPVARRLSWASSRQTKKIEDEAYSLLGIFDVNMPMLYGEGEHAFTRLQEEIISSSNDMTVFAWKEQTNDSPQAESSSQRGILARSLNEFRDAGAIFTTLEQRINPVFSLTNKGLHIRTTLEMLHGTDDCFLSLNCHENRDPGGTDTKGILLRFRGAATYVRTHATDLASQSRSRQVLPIQDVYIVKNKLAASQYDSNNNDNVKSNNKNSKAKGTSSGSKNTNSYPSLLPQEALSSSGVDSRFANNTITLHVNDPTLVERVSVDNPDDWYEPGQKFITAGLPRFRGYVRFTTKNMLAEGLNDFVLECGLDGSSNGDGKPWVRLARYNDEIDVTHIARQKQQDQEEAILKFSLTSPTSRDAKGRPTWGTHGLVVKASVATTDFGENRNYHVKLTAEPWKTPGRSAVGLMVAIVVVIIVLGVPTIVMAK